MLAAYDGVQLLLNDEKTGEFIFLKQGAEFG